MIQLPYPVSVNGMYANVGKRRVKSERYAAWLAAAGWELKAQKPTPIKGEYRMTLTAYRPDRRKRDLSNLLKAVEDLLVKHGVIEDDSLSRSIHLEWAESPMVVPAHIRVTVEPVT